MLPAQREDLLELGPLAEHLRTNFSEIIVLGTGGSSLSGRALVALTKGQSDSNGTGRVRFCDNLDSHSFELLLNDVDYERTAFLVISKSGKTPETLAQMLLCFERFSSVQNSGPPEDHFFAIVEPGVSPLRQFSDSHNLLVLDHDVDLGGRFSALSLVGLLPAMIAGLDPIQIRSGAQEVMDQVLEAKGPDQVPSALGAAWAVALQHNSAIKMNVMMPYSALLDEFGLWHRQLWAESLGKDGKGSTPIRALGPVDQHSQLQLYLDGPPDKMFTILCLDQAGSGLRIPSEDAWICGVDYMANLTIGDLISSQQNATIAALESNGCPTRIIRIHDLREKALGALFLNSMLETVFAADLLEVNPFDQPAVEWAKIASRDYLIPKNEISD